MGSSPGVRNVLLMRVQRRMARLSAVQLWGIKKATSIDEDKSDSTSISQEQKSEMWTAEGWKDAAWSHETQLIFIYLYIHLYIISLFAVSKHKM